MFLSKREGKRKIRNKFKRKDTHTDEQYSEDFSGLIIRKMARLSSALSTHRETVHNRRKQKQRYNKKPRKVL
jgi:hypothetical protein